MIDGRVALFANLHVNMEAVPEIYRSLLQAVVAPPYLDEMRHDL
jgi:hypothetical protein